MSTTHIVTGATGLIGAALILTVTEHSDDEMVCLVRPTGLNPQTRLHEVLERAGAAYGTPRRTLDAALKRTRAVTADLTDDLTSLRLPLPSEPRRVEVWHSAAHMNFRPGDWRTTFSANVRGTRRMLALARRLDAEAFNYLSTAYVAGWTEGLIREEPVTLPVARNPYELSKIAAERMLSAASDMTVRILRPSVVVGHSHTLRYPGTPSGAYRIQQLIAAYHRTRPHGTPTRIRALAHQPFNLVPIDQVVRQAYALSRLGPAADGVFHLTNPTPPTTGDLLRALTANCHAPEPEFTTDATTLTPADLRLDMALGVYRPFLNNPQDFSRDRIDAALTTPDAFTWTLDQATLQALFRPFAQTPSRHETE